jgi:hypothetical protein
VSRSVLAEVGDDDTAAADHLTGLAFLVNAAHTGPFAQLLVVVNLDQIDSVLVAQSFDQLGVHRLVAVGRQHAQRSLTSVGDSEREREREKVRQELIRRERRHCIVKERKKRYVLVQSLDGFTQTTCKTVASQSSLEHNVQGGVQIHVGVWVQNAEGFESWFKRQHKKRKEKV